jgi:hypothetical protein
VPRFPPVPFADPAVDLLQADGFDVHIPDSIPVNDDRSYGQVVEYGGKLKS